MSELPLTTDCYLIAKGDKVYACVRNIKNARTARVELGIDNVKIYKVTALEEVAG